MRIFLGVILFLSFQSSCYPQVAISYNPFTSWLGISSSTEGLFWVNFKVETNAFITNLNSEVSPMINVRRGEIANYYLGSGFNFNFMNSFQALNILNGYLLTVGSRIKPFEKVRNLSFIFEISPYVNKDFNSGLLRTNLGVSYLFGKMKRYQNNLEQIE